MTNLFTYTIELREKMSHTLRRVGGSIVDNTKKVRGLRSEVNNLDKASVNGLSKSFGGLFKSLAPAAMFAAAIYKITQLLGTSQESYKAQSVAEQRLATVMGNTMGARREEMKSILELTAAQQKLGVIGDEVQLAGAQELATYLSKKSSLEKLIPVMNDMLAQQYGLNASQEQAQQIASMLGKVMDGQVGALSRYGYKFDAAQEKILKYGTEAQRVATLFDVVTSAVGGVNQALAQTPEGKEQQRINALGDMKERLGALVISVKAAFEPIENYLAALAEKLLVFWENNGETIRIVVGEIAQAVIWAFDLIGTAIGWVYNSFKWFINGVMAGKPVFIAIAAVITGLVAGMLVFKTIVLVITAATKVWTAVNWLLNSSLLANPVVLIVAGIVALIAVIAYVCYKIEGWGSLWKGTVDFMKYTFMAYVDSVKLYFNALVNGIMIGLDMIKLGWYKFKEACGIGDSAENQAAIAKINADVEARQKAIVDGAKKVAENARKAQESLSGISMKWNSEKSLSDITSGLKAKLGIGVPGVPGMADSGSGSGADSGSGGGGGTETGKSASSIATGGSKTTHITINLGNLVHTMTVNSGDIREGAQKVREIVLDELSRALTMAQANA